MNLAIVDQQMTVCGGAKVQEEPMQHLRNHRQSGAGNPEDVPSMSGLSVWNSGSMPLPAIED